jgi:hypothetical protein
MITGGAMVIVQETASLVLLNLIKFATSENDMKFVNSAIDE